MIICFRFDVFCLSFNITFRQPFKLIWGARLSNAVLESSLSRSWSFSGHREPVCMLISQRLLVTRGRNLLEILLVRVYRFSRMLNPRMSRYDCTPISLFAWSLVLTSINQPEYYRKLFLSFSSNRIINDINVKENIKDEQHSNFKLID